MTNKNNKNNRDLNTLNGKELNDLKVTQLRVVAQKWGIDGRSKMNKAALVEAVNTAIEAKKAAKPVKAKEVKVQRKQDNERVRKLKSIASTVLYEAMTEGKDLDMVRQNLSKTLVAAGCSFWDAQTFLSQAEGLAWNNLFEVGILYRENGTDVEYIHEQFEMPSVDWDDECSQAHALLDRPANRAKRVQEKLDVLEANTGVNRSQADNKTYWSKRTGDKVLHMK